MLKNVNTLVYLNHSKMNKKAKIKLIVISIIEYPTKERLVSQNKLDDIYHQDILQSIIFEPVIVTPIIRKNLA